MATVVPSVLTRDPAELADKIRRLEPLSELIQIDIMDGAFVPNVSIGPADLARITTSAQLEAHLMVERPEKYMADFVRAGVGRVVFHVEPVKDVDEMIARGRDLGVQVGIAVNPQTPASAVQEYLAESDLVLVMSVHPGFQGRDFLPESLDKIRELKGMDPAVKVEIDGGINLETAPGAVAAGADILNVGSFLFKDGNLEANWLAMRKIAESA